MLQKTLQYLKFFNQEQDDLCEKWIEKKRVFILFYHYYFY